MKIVLTIEEVKNIISAFIHKKEGGEKPKEVCFVHKFSDNSGETDVEDVARIDRVEIRY